ncbi:MAG: helix-turn-helix domain-containing protein [Gaiellaceae bacterium]
MSLHRNAKLGLGGRLALVGAIEGGLSIRAAACRFNVSPATAHRWWRRWGEADEEMRRTLSCLDDRSSRPHRSPRELASVLQEDLRLPPKDGLGTAVRRRRDRLCPLDRVKVLHRAGLSRPPRAQRESANRYEWPCPGDLLHMDVSEYVRFRRPGHRVTGDRRSQDNILRDPRRFPRAYSRGLPRACAHLLCRPWHRRQAGADRQRLGVHAQPRLSPAPRRARARAPHD